MVSLAGGMPAPSTFPFSGVSVDMADGSKYKVCRSLKHFQCLLTDLEHFGGL